MKKIFLLHLLFLSAICFSQQTSYTSLAEALRISIPSCGVIRAEADTNKKDRIIMRCQASQMNTDPLIVVDGVLWPEEKKFSEIDPGNIERIDILKGATATVLYGYRASCGVILVTTKRPGFEKFSIKDSIDGSPLAGATVTIISPQNIKEKFQFIADDSGIVRTDKLKSSSGYDITVSAVGYKTAEVVFSRGKNSSEKSAELFLGRDLKYCSEVILTNQWHNHSGCGRAYIVQRVTDCQFITLFKKNNDSLIPINNNLTVLFNLFPNPAPKGSIIKVQIKAGKELPARLRVVSINGYILLDHSEKAVKGTNLINIPTDPRWSAGIYFVQLVYENGRVAASEKIIIQ